MTPTLNADELHPRAKAILAAFRKAAKQAKGKPFAFPFRAIAEAVGCTTSTASKWVERLITVGLIEIVESGTHSGTAHSYRLA